MNRPHAPSRSLLVVVAAAGLLCAAPLAIAQANDADKLYRSATGLLGRGMNELAAEEYRSFLNAHAGDPREATARYGLGVCLSRLGKHSEACVELERVVAGPSHGFEFAADALLLLGQSQLLCDKPQPAAASLSRFLKEHADHKQADAATALLGEAQMRAGDDAGAALTFGGLAERWPESASRNRADLLWSIVDSNAGRTKEAADRLAALRRRAPADPSAAQATLLEAQCRHRLGESERARELYRAVAEGEDASLRPDGLVGEAQLVRAGGKPKDARRVLERVLSDSRRSLPPATEAAARLELGRCRLDEGDVAGAFAELEKVDAAAVPAVGDDVAYWLARCDARAGRHAEAAARLSGCEQRFASSELLAEMMYERADALARAGDGAEADAALAALRARFPQNELAAEALLTRAASAYQAGDDETARRLSEEFLRATPGHPRAATAELIVAECRYRAGEFAEAEAAYGTFVAAHPDDQNAWHATVRRGLCLSRLGKQEEAAAVLRPALQDAKAGDAALRRAATVALADAAFAASDWKGAEAWFSRITSDRDGARDEAGAEVMEDALLKLGLSMHRQGRPQEAIEVYERLTREYPHGRHGMQGGFERGQALLDLKRDAEAAACFEKVIEGELNSEEPRFTSFAKRHLAAIASRAGRPEEAARMLGEVAEAAGDAEAARLRLDQGVALLAAGKSAEAEEALRAAVSDSGVGSEARAQLGVAVSRQGRLEEAMTLLDGSVAEGASLQAGTREGVAYERASILRQLGRDEDAAEAYRAFLAASPSARLGTHAAVELAQVQAKMGRFDDCLAALDAGERSAASADAETRAAVRDHAAYLRGLSEHRLGRHAQAARTLGSLLKERPESPLRGPAALVCGEALLKNNQSAEAAKLFQEVVRTARDADLAAPALLRLGEASAASQNWTGSEQAFTEFLSRFSESPVWFQAQFGIGWARENQGRHEGAIDAYRVVTEKHDGATAARAQFQIGECLFAMKKHDEAVKELLRVDILYSYPEWSAAALYEAGRCLREQNKTAEARAQFQQVVERFPKTEWARLAGPMIEQSKPQPLPGRDASAKPDPKPTREVP